jgi:cobyric acid synthase
VRCTATCRRRRVVHEFKPELKELVSEIYEKLAAKNDIIVLEGAAVRLKLT